MVTSLQLNEVGNRPPTSDLKELTAQELLQQLAESRRPVAETIIQLCYSVLLNERRAVAIQYTDAIERQDPSFPLLAVIANGLSAGQSPEAIVTKLGKNADTLLRVSQNFSPIPPNVREALEILRGELKPLPESDQNLPFLDAVSLLFAIRAAGGKDQFALLIQLVEQLAENLPTASMEQTSSVLPVREAKAQVPTVESKSAIEVAFQEYLNETFRSCNLLTVDNQRVISIPHVLHWIESHSTLKYASLQTDAQQYRESHMVPREKLTPESEKNATDKRLKYFFTFEGAFRFLNLYKMRLITPSPSQSSNG